MMSPWSKAAMDGTARYLRTIEAARELDPQAFKPVMVPHFTDKQILDQQAAMRRAAKAMNNTEQPK